MCEVSRVGQMLDFLQNWSFRVTMVLFQYETLRLGVYKRKASAGGN